MGKVSGDAESERVQIVSSWSSSGAGTPGGQLSDAVAAYRTGRPTAGVLSLVWTSKPGCRHAHEHAPHRAARQIFLVD